ncbi:MAG: hypothetical protein CBD27_06820 [Rhodospirillaceae bacterium TMED167]|nr:hypothetical protein [Rhodospirillaceae bacterium]OUW27148.1 MAG: hypothetical protein CBD27_06820 [Rhodospirillaceae bacterium TMED167]
MTTTITVILTSVFATAFISGVLSLGGGSILMGIFGWVLPISTAMILHGVTQAAANASRSWIYRDHIQWHILGYYFIGAAVCTSIFSWLAFIPNKAMLFLCLGLLPFVHLLLPKGHALDITRPGNAISCGFVVSASLLVAGVSGSILDIYYVKTSLTRFQVHATKGVTQAIGHVVKIAYFVLILGLMEDGLGPLPLWIFIAVIPMAYFGSVASRRVLQAMEDQQFKNYTQTATMVVGAIFLTKGIQLLLAGPL